MRYLLLFLWLTICNGLSAQDSDFVHRMQKRGRDEAARNVELYNREKIAVHQKAVLEGAKRVNQEVRILLKGGLDTTGISRLLLHTQAAVDIVKDGIFVHIGTNQAQRNLVTSSTILIELSKRLERQKKSLDDYGNALVDFRVKIDSLQGDSLVYNYSSDSVDIVNYSKKLAIVEKELSPADSSLNQSLASVQALQLRTDLAVYELRSLQEDIELYSHHLSRRALHKEFPYFWESRVLSRPFDQVIRFSVLKESLVLRYYVEANGLTVFFLLVCLCGTLFFLRALKKQLGHENNLNTDSAGQFVVRSPMLSATLLTFCIFQFFFADPPFILYFIFWLISAICLFFIMHKVVPGYWRQFWIVIGSLFVLSGLDNMILQPSREERWFTLVLATIGMIYSILIHFNKYKRDLQEKGVVYFINFVFVCQLLSVVLNLLGRFNLAKTFLVSGYSGVLIALLFLWVIRLVNEGLKLASAIYKHPSRRLFFINFSRVGSEVHPFFYVLLVLGWFFLVGKNFYALKWIYDFMVDQFTAQRAVGDYKFSIMGMLEFFLILISAMLLSKLVSIFATEPVGVQKGREDKKFKLGSYILLIRIFIICLGLFFSFAAAGISLDKITILFGALGVGIGLGLQGLVTNLVSGLILSFERPVNVGDLIEFNGKVGTMKSIGFRSSIISSYDGACIIIPNGELLSHQMINWTMGQNLKRNELTVSVAYGSDLEKVETLISQMLKDDDRILHYPAPEVFIKGFNQGSIDVEVIFWPKHMSMSNKVKSDLILNIDAGFKKEGIVIPYPKHDVYIHAAAEGVVAPEGVVGPGGVEPGGVAALDGIVVSVPERTVDPGRVVAPAEPQK